MISIISSSQTKEQRAFTPFHFKDLLLHHLFINFTKHSPILQYRRVQRCGSQDTMLQKELWGWSFKTQIPIKNRDNTGSFSNLSIWGGTYKEWSSQEKMARKIRQCHWVLGSRDPVFNVKSNWGRDLTSAWGLYKHADIHTYNVSSPTCKHAGKKPPYIIL